MPHCIAHRHLASGLFLLLKTANPGIAFRQLFSGLSTLLPKPAAAPAAHSILKNGAVASSSYIPVYEKQKSVLGPGSASPYSTLSRDLSRPGSSMSNGKPEPTPWVYCLDKIPEFNSGADINNNVLNYIIYYFLFFIYFFLLDSEPFITTNLWMTTRWSSARVTWCTSWRSVTTDGL